MRFARTLYARLAAVLLVLFLFVGALAIGVTLRSAELYTKRFARRSTGRSQLISRSRSSPSRAKTST